MRSNEIRRLGAGALALGLLLAGCSSKSSNARTERSDQGSVGSPAPGRPTANATSVGSTSPTTPGGSGAKPYQFVPFADAQKKGIKVSFGPDCDTKLGRIKVPALGAPPCVPPFPKGADNGGVTHLGVTRDAITVAYYLPPNNEAMTAANYSGGGFTPTEPEQAKKAVLDYVDYFQDHYETYGRKVKVVFVEAGGPATDAVAAKADAIKVATDIKAFASLGGPKGAPTYTKELAARKIVCIRCLEAMPQTFYERYAPYLWGMYQSQTQMVTDMAEWIGKGLWARTAKWAGDPLVQQNRRVFAHVFMDTPEGDRKVAADEMDREMARYGASFRQRISYVVDLARAQEQARTIITKLKADGVTTVLLSTDWVYPVFFTQEATRQRYSPEWIAGLQTTGITFSRSYDQTQWSHAFGLSNFPARLPRSLEEDVRLFTWHHGSAPPDGVYAYRELWPFFTGVHLAGPRLTPETFRDGLFSYPPTGGISRRGVASYQVSYGRHGLFPYDDYSGVDDSSEMWWDATARGQDEFNKDGLGMWSYVAGGLRHLRKWPRTEPRLFDPNGSVTAYQSIPPSDRPPSYPHQQYG